MLIWLSSRGPLISPRHPLEGSLSDAGVHRRFLRRSARSSSRMFPSSVRSTRLRLMPNRPLRWSAASAESASSWLAPYRFTSTWVLVRASWVESMAVLRPACQAVAVALGSGRGPSTHDCWNWGGGSERERRAPQGSPAPRRPPRASYRMRGQGIGLRGCHGWKAGDDAKGKEKARHAQEATAIVISGLDS